MFFEIIWLIKKRLFNITVLIIWPPDSQNLILYI